MSERAAERVLVIDDDDLSREVLGLLLADEGYSVESAGSGEEALSGLAAHASDPDVVLMDMQMPGISGGELARQLRDASRGPTVLIAMSGSRPPDEASGVWDAFLLKPFSMAEFGSTLEGLRRVAGPSAAVIETRASPGSQEVLDEKIFAGFAGMMGEGPLRELYGMCLSDAERQMNAMREAAAMGDDGAFRRSAHASKGSLGMLGARELEGICTRLEEVGLADGYAATLAEFATALQHLGDKLAARGVQPRGNIQK